MTDTSYTHRDMTHTQHIIHIHDMHMTHTKHHTHTSPSHHSPRPYRVYEIVFVCGDGFILVDVETEWGGGGDVLGPPFGTDERTDEGRRDMQHTMSHVMRSVMQRATSSNEASVVTITTASCNTSILYTDVSFGTIVSTTRISLCIASSMGMRGTCSFGIHRVRRL